MASDLLPFLDHQGLNFPPLRLNLLPGPGRRWFIFVWPGPPGRLLGLSNTIWKVRPRVTCYMREVLCMLDASCRGAAHMKMKRLLLQILPWIKRSGELSPNIWERLKAGSHRILNFEVYDIFPEMVLAPLWWGLAALFSSWHRLSIIKTNYPLLPGLRPTHSYIFKWRQACISHG